VRLFRVARTPDLIEQLVVRQELSGVPDQRRQQSVFDGRQMDRLPRKGYLPLRQVYLQVADRELRLAGIAGSTRCVS